jgi:hypothetical protein
MRYRNRNAKKTGHINIDMKTTFWWEPRSPNVINVCTGDARFVNDEGGSRACGSRSGAASATGRTGTGSPGL